MLNFIKNHGKDIYMVVATLCIIALLIMLNKCKTRDNFCLCSGANVGGRRKMCNGGVTKKEYNDGMTEYSDMAKMQMEQGGPKWSTVSPGDMAYPEQDGNCPDMNDVV
jgi:hypothetical protein